MRYLYDFIFLIFAIVYVPYLLIEGKWHGGLLLRFGSFDESQKRKFRKKQNIWIHAVSVGEVLAVEGLIKRIEENFEDCQIVLSTVTPTGHKLARSKFKNAIVIYAPLDFSFVVRKYIRLINPIIYINAETEIWPNIFMALKEYGVDIVLVNGRISNTSFERYQRITFLTKKVLGYVKKFCMQSKLDASRIVKLGADRKNVEIVGNMKFDNSPEFQKLTFKDIGFPDKTSLFIGGSTHPGEEKVLLNVFNSLSGKFPYLRLVLVPRHIERTNSIMDLVKEKGLAPVRFSRISETKIKKDSVIVVDTIGHLRSLYSLATMVFVGKTLVGSGGQNIIEPASFKKPIIVGPNMQNFKDIMDCFLKEKAIVQVKDEASLLLASRRLLNDPASMRRLGQAAKRAIESNKGATQQTFKIISTILKKKIAEMKT